MLRFQIISWTKIFMKKTSIAIQIHNYLFTKERMKALIIANSISKTFYLPKKEIHALKPTTLNIKKGEVFGFLGPNGAGKTTLLRIIATILTPTSGEAKINGFDIKTQVDEVKNSIGFLSGSTKLYGRLTPIEILKYFGELHEMSNARIKNRIDEVIGILKMEDFSNQQVEKLSTGQIQRASIARCIFHEPSIYILDEPTLGLDILSVRTILEFIKAEKLKGKTIVFSSHIVEELEMLVDRLALIYDGEIIENDTLNNIKSKTNENNLTDIFFEYVNKRKKERI